MKIAFLTAGGLAPCLAASIGALIEEYNRRAPEAELVGYLHGYRGLLLGNSLVIPQAVREQVGRLYRFGGSPIGNSRVKLTNVKDCIQRGFIQEGQDPLQVAAEQLIRDGITILHTIGGDDTNTMAAELSRYLKRSNYELTVVGLPKTVDNDVYPIAQTLGAWTAAEQGAIHFTNIANENTTSTRQLLIHEVMGRNCGWLTAATAREYRNTLEEREFLPEFLITPERWNVDAVYIPEMELDLEAETRRLVQRMDEKDGVNIFLSEGAGIGTIMAELEAQGEEVPRDAFGHLRLDKINPGQWFARHFAQRLDAYKVLVQKSGYFARSAAPGPRDLELIKRSGRLAAQLALEGRDGVVGLDEDNNAELGLIDFERIKGGKPFNIDQAWFKALLAAIGQPLGKKLN